MKDIGFSPADILLPVESISMERWAVVACDQFTSQKEYWEEADRIAGDSPSTLRLILPECYLEESDKEERIRNARNLKKLGVSPDVIAQATGLSLEEIAKL